jgi:hypothetical protein
MKRSEVLLNLQRFYTQKHVMVEFKYTTKDEFMDQVLQLVEEMGMRPPYNAADDDETDSCEWEKE